MAIKRIIVINEDGSQEEINIEKRVDAPVVEPAPVESAPEVPAEVPEVAPE